MAVVGRNYALLERRWVRTSGLPHLAGVGVRPYPRPATDAKSLARAAPVAVVIFHRPAQLAPDSRAGANAEHGNEITMSQPWRTPLVKDLRGGFRQLRPGAA